MTGEWVRLIRETPPFERLELAEWTDRLDCPNGTVILDPEGRVGVVDAVPLGDLIVEYEPEPTDRRVQQYVRDIRLNRSIRPLRVDLIDGNLVLRDGSCRYTALMLCKKTRARAIIRCA